MCLVRSTTSFRNFLLKRSFPCAANSQRCIKNVQSSVVDNFTICLTQQMYRLFNKVKNVFDRNFFGFITFFTSSITDHERPKGPITSRTFAWIISNSLSFGSFCLPSRIFERHGSIALTGSVLAGTGFSLISFSGINLSNFSWA